MSRITANEVLAAIRRKHRKDAIVRELVLDDLQVLAERRRWDVDHRSQRTNWAKYYEKRGLEVAPPLADGYDPRTEPPRRRIDALLVESGLQLTAIEIKVTRADFLRETDAKRRAWRELSGRFVYAAPKGLLDPAEIPGGCGLWEFDPEAVGRYVSQHGVSVKVRAKKNRHPSPFPPQLITALAYRVSITEHKQERSLV